MRNASSIAVNPNLCRAGVNHFIALVLPNARRTKTAGLPTIPLYRADAAHYVGSHARTDGDEIPGFW
jgi:hypothetical protein